MRFRAWSFIFPWVFLVAPRCSTLAAEARPSVVCSSAVYDFGTLPSTTQVVHCFVIQNQGTAPLVMKNVRACCGATFKLLEKTVAPGTSTVLEVRLSLAERRGKVVKSIYLQSNDEQQPFYQLQMLGIVQEVPAVLALKPLTAIPEYLDFEQIRSDAEVSRTVEFRTATTGAFHLTSMACTAAWCRVTMETNGVGRALRVVTVPPMPVGKLHAVVTVNTDLHECPTLSIPVAAAVFDDLVVVPHELAFQLRNDVRPVTRYMAIRSRSGKPFKILKIEAPDLDIKITSLPMESGGYRLTLENVLPFEDMNGKELRITTDSQPHPIISVPIRVGGE